MQVELNNFRKVENDPLRFSMLVMNGANMIVIYYVFFAGEKNNIIMDSKYRGWKFIIFLIIQVLTVGT